MQWYKLDEIMPKQSGVYLVAYQHPNYPFNINCIYFDGQMFKSTYIFPIEFWSELPDGPQKKDFS